MYETVRRLESDQVSARAPGKDREHPGVVYAWCLALSGLKKNSIFNLQFTVLEA